MNICIYGASSAELKKIYYEKTEELGQLMGKRGHGLVFGGGKEGLMGAAAGVLTEKKAISWVSHRDFLTSRECCMSIVQSLFLLKICVRGSTCWKAARMRLSWYLGELVLMRSFLRFQHIEESGTDRQADRSL